MTDKICSCPTEFREGRIARAYLDSQCAIHGQLEFDERRVIASFCETTMRVVLVLEDLAQFEEKGSRIRSELEMACKKLRSAVLAAT